MKKFFGVSYVGREDLKDNNIYHPIRLEYYKLENEEQSSYGIEIIKTEYPNQEGTVVNKVIEEITHDEKEIDMVLEKFKNRNCHTKWSRRCY